MQWRSWASAIVTVVLIALAATACSVDEVEMVDTGDMGDTAPATVEAPAVPAVTAEPSPPSEPRGTSPDDGLVPGTEAFCLEFPGDRACDEFFANLSDEEFCRIIPDDELCDELLEDVAPLPPPIAPDTDARREPPPTAEVPTDRSPDDGSIAVAGIDATLTRADGRCLPDEDEADQGGIEYNLAYQVVEGTLGAVCFGSPDETVEWAWQVLADLTPPDQLRDLSVFGGFASTEEEGVTLAFVQRLDDDGTEYLMAVNIAETEADPDEAILTMAHEFSHVFTALPTELDRTIFPSDCTTFDNGEGCYEPDSIINLWFEEFWTSAPGDPTDEDDAGPRCDLDEGFFGNYAASTPEEDFAEAFSAYVLQLEARTDGQQRRLEFIDGFPGLREFRDRAIALGYGPLENRFDLCG